MDQVNEYAQNQIANLGRECQELSEVCGETYPMIELK